MSMPSSSEEVATSARSVPAFSASSISRRCWRAIEPWCARARTSPASSLIAAASRSARRRLFTNSSVERCARTSSTSRGWMAVQIVGGLRLGPVAARGHRRLIESRHVLDGDFEAQVERLPRAGIDDRHGSPWRGVKVDGVRAEPGHRRHRLRGARGRGLRALLRLPPALRVVGPAGQWPSRQCAGPGGLAVGRPRAGDAPRARPPRRARAGAARGQLPSLAVGRSFRRPRQRAPEESRYLVERPLRRRESDALQRSPGEVFQPFDRECEVGATLGGHQRVDLVENDRVDRPEHVACARSQQQVERFRRRDEDVGRLAPEPAALGSPGVTGAHRHRRDVMPIAALRREMDDARNRRARLRSTSTASALSGET